MEEQQGSPYFENPESPEQNLGNKYWEGFDYTNPEAEEKKESAGFEN